MWGRSHSAVERREEESAGGPRFKTRLEQQQTVKTDIAKRRSQGWMDHKREDRQEVAEEE